MTMKKHYLWAYSLFFAFFACLSLSAQIYKAKAVFTAVTECHGGRPEGSKSGSVICDGGIVGTTNTTGEKLSSIND